jgi:ketosteroid isomerase-like protein
MLETDTLETLRTLDAKRAEAMDAADTVALDMLYADDFGLVHGDGGVDDKAGALNAAVAIRRRTVRPRDLTIRLFGDTALLTGPTTLAVGPEAREVTVFMTQIVRRDAEGQWRYVWAQVTMVT